MHALLLSALLVASPQVLVEGQPPLTDELAGRFTEFFEWALDATLTAEQRAVVEKDLIDTWKKQDKDGIEGVVGAAEQQRELAKLSADQRELLRHQVTEALLAELKKEKDEPLARWALAVYAASHQPLAKGPPPLTRQHTDAFLELLCFMIAEAVGTQFTPDAALKDAWAKSWAADWKKLNAAQRGEIVKKPLEWAAVRTAWAALPEPDKQKHRAEWGQAVAKMWPQPEQPAQAGAAAGPKKTAAELMRQSANRHNMFMSMMSSSMNAHYTRMNAINAMGNNPYRYQPRYW